MLIETGRPTSSENRLEKELAVYDLLERLHIPLYGQTMKPLLQWMPATLFPRHWKHPSARISFSATGSEPTFTCC